MKKTILYFIIMMLYASTQGQGFKKKAVTGSWINTNVTDVYESRTAHDCDEGWFVGDKFIPLYISFENENLVRITNRLEQRISTCKVSQTTGSIIFSGGKNIFHVINDTLIRSDDNLITFKKVSDKFSKDVFGEYMKDVIFREHNSYTVTSFKDRTGYTGFVFTKRDIIQKIKELFKAGEGINFALSFFKFGELCLPEIALYYDKGHLWGGNDNPRVLGILQSGDSIKFIDKSGAEILVLNANQ